MNVGVIIGFLVAVIVVLAYTHVRGCSNGHHWGEWEETGHYKFVPHRGKSLYTLQKRVETECCHESCNASEREWKMVVDVYEDELDEFIEEMGDK